MTTNCQAISKRPVSGYYRINIAFTIVIAKTHWFAQELSVSYYAPAVARQAAAWSEAL
jgi:hypothetical protein